MMTHTAHSLFEFAPPGLPNYNWVVQISALCASCNSEAVLFGDRKGGTALVCQDPNCGRVVRYEEVKSRDVFHHLLRFAADRLPPPRREPPD